MSLLLFLCAFVPLFYKHTNALPGGAPVSTCTTMQPSLTKHGAAQTTNPPYVIEVDKSYYGENSTVKVYIKACGDATIGGFLIQARKKDEKIPLGRFTKMPPETKHLDCTSMSAETAWSAVTHSSVLKSKMLSFEWQPYSNMTTGDIYFMATIAKDRPTYWLGVKSVKLMKMSPNMTHSDPDNMKCPGSGGTTPSMGGGNGTMPTSKGNIAISSVAANIVLLILAFSAKFFI